MDHETVSGSAAAIDVLPYLRAALARLTAKQRGDAIYCLEEYAAPYLLAELRQHGLAIVTTLPAKGPPGRTQRGSPLPPAAPAALAPASGGATAARQIRYTQAESNRLLKVALAQAWPATRFFVRADKYGSTDVYYRYQGAAPALAEVREVTAPFTGQRTNQVDGRDTLYHLRTGADGYPEQVSYATGLLSVHAVVTHGPASFRRDGLTHLSDVFPLSLRKSLTGKK